MGFCFCRLSGSNRFGSCQDERFRVETSELQQYSSCFFLQRMIGPEPWKEMTGCGINSFQKGSTTGCYTLGPLMLILGSCNLAACQRLEPFAVRRNYIIVRCSKAMLYDINLSQEIYIRGEQGNSCSHKQVIQIDSTS